MDYNYTLLNIDKQVKFPSNTRLIEALKELQQKHTHTPKDALPDSLIDEFTKKVAKAKDIADFKVSKYINRGASAMVFETPEGDILKLTLENHFPMNRPHADFDVPVYKKGKSGKIFYYIEEKLYQRGLSEGFVEIMKDKIQSEGYKINDLYDCDVQQIGLSKKGELYLLDPECAQYKTIFHAIFDKLKRLMFK